MYYYLVQGPQVKDGDVQSIVNTLSPNCIQVGDLSKAEAILVLGGDGTILHAIRDHYRTHLPFFGLNFGHEGFLLNQPSTDVVRELCKGDVDIVKIRLLRGKFYDSNNELIATEYAVNDIYLKSLKTTAHINVNIDGVLYWDAIPCDGVIVASPAGSTAYSHKAGSPILPITSNLNMVTVIAGGKQGCPVSDTESVTLTACDTDFRPVFGVADNKVFDDAVKVVITTSEVVVLLGFVKSQRYDKKVQRLQFK